MHVRTDVTSKNALFGIVLMLVHALSVAAIYTSMKTLNQYITTSQAVFFYKFTLLLCILPWVFFNGVGAIKTRNIKLYASRGILSTFAAICFFSALKHIPMADATALGYMEHIFLLIVGILCFKEKFSKSKLIAIMASFLGAVLVVRPELFVQDTESLLGFSVQFSDYQFNIYYILIFLSVLLWGSNCIIVKILGRTESTKTQTFYSMLFSSIFSFPAAFINWQPIELMGLQISKPLGWIELSSINFSHAPMWLVLVLALSYFLHSVCYFNALRFADISTAVTFDYTRMLFTGLLGYHFLGERPSGVAYIGYLLIMLAGIYLARSEAIRHKKNKMDEMMKEEVSHTA